jgi:hypothetical protein
MDVGIAPLAESRTVGEVARRDDFKSFTALKKPMGLNKRLWASSIRLNRRLRAESGAWALNQIFVSTNRI